MPIQDVVEICTPGPWIARLPSSVNPPTNVYAYCEDLGGTHCPPDRAGMVDVTQRVVVESSFTLAKGNIDDNGILKGHPFRLLMPAGWGVELLEVHDRKRRERTTTRHPNIQLPNGRGGIALQAAARLWRLRLREIRALGWLAQGGRAKLQDGTRPGEEKREGGLGEMQGNNEVRDNLPCDGILRGDWELLRLDLAMCNSKRKLR